MTPRTPPLQEKMSTYIKQLCIREVPPASIPVTDTLDTSPRINVAVHLQKKGRAHFSAPRSRKYYYLSGTSPRPNIPSLKSMQKEKSKTPSLSSQNPSPVVSPTKNSSRRRQTKRVNAPSRDADHRKRGQRALYHRRRRPKKNLCRGTGQYTPEKKGPGGLPPLQNVAQPELSIKVVPHSKHNTAARCTTRNQQASKNPKK